MMSKREKWQGTATELLDLFGPAIRIANAKVLSDELTEIAPMLRTIGVDIRFHRSNGRRGIAIVGQCRT